MAVPKALQLAVRARAQDRCEYCRSPQSAYRLRFWVDHITPIQHLGATELENLALSCPYCNRHKGPNLSGIDPSSKTAVSLFNPRVHLWDEHFEINALRIVGRTPIGRATVHVLAMNHPDQVVVRRALLREGLLLNPPSDRQK